jgi:Kef-type K+ transport system membrane component KefB
VIGAALGFVIAFLIASRYAHNLLDRLGPKLDAEQLLLGALAIVLGGAALAEMVHLSEAVGALLAGIFVLVTALVGVVFMRESRRVGRGLFPRRATRGSELSRR